MPPPDATAQVPELAPKYCLPSLWQIVKRNPKAVLRSAQPPGGDYVYSLATLATSILRANNMSQLVPGKHLTFSLGYHRSCFKGNTLARIKRFADSPSLYTSIFKINPKLASKIGHFVVEVEIETTNGNNHRSTTPTAATTTRDEATTDGGSAAEMKFILTDGCRSATLSQFMGAVMPALEALRVSSRTTAPDIEECCICFERIVQVLSPCHHPFCERCYITLSGEPCPLCRQESPEAGNNHFILAESVMRDNSECDDDSGDGGVTLSESAIQQAQERVLQTILSLSPTS